MRVFFKIMLLMAFIGSAASADLERDNSLTDMSLEQLLSIEIDVASGEGKGQSVRESPGIVTVVTREDIDDWGARDLIDVFHMVPGLQLGQDVQGYLGPLVRGLWGAESKVLLLWDGLPMNDLTYGYAPLSGMNFVEHIDQIEIIRGPGSALYGGAAELTVINIKSRSIENDDYVALTYGSGQDNLARANLSVGIDQKLGDWDLDVTLAAGEGHRGDGTHQEYDGTLFSLDDYFEINESMVALSLARGDFRFSLVSNRFDSGSSLPGLPVEPDNAINTITRSTVAEIKYRWNLNERMTLTPKVVYADIDSWRNDDEEAWTYGFYYRYPANRLTTGLTFGYDQSERFSLTAGAEYYRDEGTIDAIAPEWLTFSDGSRRVNYNNTTLFAQATIASAVGNWTVGARYDEHSAFGGVFVPRIGLTKVFDRFHYKLLLSEAYRAPTILNLDFQPEIEPEETTVMELEFGYQLSEASILTVNLFDQEVNDVIVYSVGGDVTAPVSNYFNFPVARTRGIEADYRYRTPQWRFNLGYSFYDLVENEVSLYAAYDRHGNLEDGSTLGAANHKLTLYVGRKFAGGWHAGATLLQLSKRYGLQYDAAAETTVPFDFDGKTIVSANIHKKNLGVEGLQATLAISDIFGEQMDFHPGYNTGFTALNAFEREVTFRLSYRY